MIYVCDLYVVLSSCLLSVDTDSMASITKSVSNFRPKAQVPDAESPACGAISEVLESVGNRPSLEGGDRGR